MPREAVLRSVPSCPRKPNLSRGLHSPWAEQQARRLICIGVCGGTATSPGQLHLWSELSFNACYPGRIACGAHMTCFLMTRGACNAACSGARPQRSVMTATRHGSASPPPPSPPGPLHPRAGQLIRSAAAATAQLPAQLTAHPAGAGVGLRLPQLPHAARAAGQPGFTGSSFQRQRAVAGPLCSTSPTAVAGIRAMSGPMRHI